MHRHTHMQTVSNPVHIFPMRKPDTVVSRPNLNLPGMDIRTGYTLGYQSNLSRSNMSRTVHHVLTPAYHIMDTPAETENQSNGSVFLPRHTFIGLAANCIAENITFLFGQCIILVAGNYTQHKPLFVTIRQHRHNPLARHTVIG